MNETVERIFLRYDEAMSQLSPDHVPITPGCNARFRPQLFALVSAIVEEMEQDRRPMVGSVATSDVTIAGTIDTVDL